MIKPTETDNPFVASFAETKSGLPGANLDWVGKLRCDAMDHFNVLGIPTTKHEDWRFTNIKPIAQTRFSTMPPASPAAGAKGLQRFPFCDDPSARFVLLNGSFVPELSKLDNLPDGVRISRLADAIESSPDLVKEHLGQYAPTANHAFTALNTALFSDGAFVHIPKGVVFETPIVLIALTTSEVDDGASHLRNLIIAEENCQATIVEVYAGLGSNRYFNNCVTEVALAQNAVIDRYQLQEESEGAFHISTVQVHQERDSNFANQILVFGGLIARNEINCSLQGEGIESTVNGLTVGRGSQTLDNHTFIDHAKPHCNSFEVYKTILDEKAKGVFNGRIMVAEDAQKTDAKQTNQNLLLSDSATINTKPELEIFANDVRCTHGATIGQLDSEAIFYIRTRGIPEDAARSILTYAFAGYVLDRIKIESLRNHTEEMLCARLPMGDEVRGAL